MHPRPRSRTLRAVSLGCVLAATVPAAAFADDARQLLRAMSDFMARQQSFSFGYDSSIEVVTHDFQKLQFASSGSVEVSRPDKIRVSRTGGFVDVETVFDGTTLSVLGKNKNVYTQIDAKGDLDELGDRLADAGINPPGEDLIDSNIYEALMDGVTDAKHISTAYVDGVECDYLAFRRPDLDLQIWIQKGGQPVPRRYVITSKDMVQAPQYTIDTRDWKFGKARVAADFTFRKPTDAKKIDLSELADVDEVPSPSEAGDNR